MLKTEYALVTTTARATLKAGYNLALSVAVLTEGNNALPRATDAAVFFRNRAWNKEALHSYKVPEPVMRAYFGETLGADTKKATVSRGFTNGRLLYGKHSALVAMACAIPEGRNAAWTASDKVDALQKALAAEGVRSEADLVRFINQQAKPKVDKSAQEMAAAALANMLKHGGNIPEFLALAESAIHAARAGNMERAAELLAAAATVAPQAPAEAPAEMAEAA